MFKSIKKFISSALTMCVLGLPVAFLVGCAEKSLNGGVVNQEEERFPVSVSLPGLAKSQEGVTAPASKATETAGEDNVQTVQIFVFRKDGVLDAYLKSTLTSATLDCTVGEKDFWAVVNAPEITGVNTLNELKAMKSTLSSNSIGKFVMVGKTSKVVTSAKNEVSVDVSRLVARVTVKKVTNAITSPQYSSVPLVLKQIFLLNVAGDAPYGGTGEPTVWYNKMQNTGDLPELLQSNVLSENISAGSSYTTQHHFYCYPNRTSADNSEAVWSPRFTRVVFKIGFKDKDYFYPVALDGVEANTIYNIEELKITRIGSTSPDVPVSVGTVSFTINVVPWQNGPSSNIVI